MRYCIICLCFLSVLMESCKKKEKIEFALNNLTLKAGRLDHLPRQNLYLKILKVTGSAEETLAITGKYSSEYTLPAKYGLEEPLNMNFYQNTYRVALYGDSSGFIGSNPINIKDYKILYPLDMETKSQGLEIVLSGTWR